MEFRAALKRFVPGWVLDARRSLMRARLFGKNKGRGLQSIFSEAYRSGKWGTGDGKYWSGNGSSKAQSSAYVEFMVEFLRTHDEIKTYVDIGCGDFQVSGRVLANVGRPISYVGVDIVPELIEHNNQAFGSDDVRFVCADATTDPLPPGDLVSVRQVLQHLSNDNVEKVLRNTAGYRYLVVTEGVPVGPNVTPNRDIVSGHYTRSLQLSGVFIEAPPFNMPAEEVLSVPVGGGQRLRTTLSERGSSRT